MIIQNNNVMCGKPVVSGTRLTVEYVRRLLACGMTVEEIQAEYVGLSREDVEACCDIQN